MPVRRREHEREVGEAAGICSIDTAPHVGGTVICMSGHDQSGRAHLENRAWRSLCGVRAGINTGIENRKKQDGYPVGCPTYPSIVTAL
jgi:hypothetical protein